MPRDKKAAIYCRVSTIHQTDRDSLPMQKNDMVNYARYVLSITDYEIFEDAGYSGKNTDRPAFQQMMERVEDGEFSHVLVWKIDRISRNLLDFSSMYARCKKLGVTFVSKNEQFDTSTAMGEAMLKIILVFAELERNMTSERVQATMNARAAEGKWNGGRVPFGYRYDSASDSFSIIEEERQDILLMKDFYLSCHSLTDTARQMNAAGKVTRRGYKWTPATVSIILKSPFYRGTYRYNYRDESETTFSFKGEKEWVLCAKHHEAIFSEEDSARVDEWLEKNKNTHTTGHHKQGRHCHIFAGLIYCGQCGSKYSATLGRKLASGYRPSMYNCMGRYYRKSDCQNMWVNDITVGTFVLSYVSNMMALRREFSPGWKEARIRKRLLTGDIFAGVELDAEVPRKLRQTLLQCAAPSEYRGTPPPAAPLQQESKMQAELEKNTRALERLNDLYLYADEPLPQLEYLQKRKALQEKIDSLRAEIAARRTDSIIAPSLFNEQFIARSADLVFRHTLASGQEIDFPDLAQTVGHPILKDFVNTIIERITVEGGQVMAIEFKSGQLHTFTRPQK